VERTKLPGDIFGSKVIDRLTDGNLFPPSIQLEVNHTCNVRCIFCDSGKKRNLLDESQKRDQLNIEYVKKILSGTKKISIVTFSSGDGEPLLNRQLPEIVRYIKTKGAYTIIISNGTLLDNEMSSALIDSGLDEIHISLHGTTKEVSEKIMVGSRFEKIIEGIRTINRLKRLRSSKTPVIKILFNGMKRNIHQLSDMINLAEKLDISAVFLQSLVERELKPEMRDEVLMYYPELLRYEYKKAREIANQKGIKLFINHPYADILGLNEEEDSSMGDSGECSKTDVSFLPKGETRLCLFPFNKPYIGINGTVNLCCSKTARDVIMGNISENGFISVWSNAKYRNLRKGLLTGKDLPEYCIRCNREIAVPIGIMQRHIAAHCYKKNWEVVHNVKMLIKQKPYLFFKKGYRALLGEALFLLKLRLSI
jgi:MoaA/NifB/PqqE/SkfB family radical SAM enzyme